MANITLNDSGSALSADSVEPGSMAARDDYYEYNTKFSTLLRIPEDVQDIYIRKDDRIFWIEDLTKAAVVSKKGTGLSLASGEGAVILVVIRQVDENMDNIKEALAEATDYFKSICPDTELMITGSQMGLSDYTISDPEQNLSLGFSFTYIVAVLFLEDVKSPVVIELSVVISIITSFLSFYLLNMPLNIISLPRLILALGMMTDGSIIVTENIAQYRIKGSNLEEVCIKGTIEVIIPMPSSIFTMIAVSVPLAFMNGIVGTIFLNQAFAITAGLMASHLTGIMLLFVPYKLVYSISETKYSFLNLKINNLIKGHMLDRFRDEDIDFISEHETTNLLFIAVTIPPCVILFYAIPKSRMSGIGQDELIAHVEWNGNIHIDENRKRATELFSKADRLGAQYTAYIGR